MTPGQLAELIGVPSMFGWPNYPGGFPMSPDQISFEEKTLTQLYVKSVMDSSHRSVAADPLEEELLKNYVIYYLHAPCWRGLSEVLDQDLVAMSFDELTMICVDNGLDPF